jgi:hypothetical protein
MDLRQDRPEEMLHCGLAAQLLWRRSRLRQVTSGLYSPAVSCASICLGQYSYSASSIFSRDFRPREVSAHDSIKVGSYAILPFLAGFFGV